MSICVFARSYDESFCIMLLLCCVGLSLPWQATVDWSSCGSTENGAACCFGF